MPVVQRVVIQSEAHIQETLQSARSDKDAQTSVRCVGGGNSPDIEWLERQCKNSGAEPALRKRLLLLDMKAYNQSVSFDPEQRLVTFQAGAQLKAFFAWIHGRGFAVRGALNGSSEITIGGMLCTASQVGSATYSLYDDVVALRFVLADGSIRNFQKGEPDFDGVFCSLGMMGVLSTVTFRLVPAFMCQGAKSRISFASMIQLIEAQHLRQHEYMALEWYPHAGDQVLLVHADRVDMEKLPFMEKGVEARQPISISEFDAAIGKRLLKAAEAFSWLATIADHCFVLDFRIRMWLCSLASHVTWFGHQLAKWLPFGSSSKKSQRLQRARFMRSTSQAYTFFGNWMTTIPNDKDLSIHMIPVHYIEINIPMSQAAAYLRAVQKELFHKGWARVPMCPIAIDPIPAIPAWIAKNGAEGYPQHELRHGLAYITIMYSAYEAAGVEDAVKLFRPYWKLAEKMFGTRGGYKMHWGKLMNPDSTLQQLEAMFGERGWRSWMRLRSELDPEGLFLVDRIESFRHLDSQGKGPNALMLGRLIREAERKADVQAQLA